MRLWYWLISGSLVIGLALCFLGYYYIQIGESGQGSKFMVYGAVLLGVFAATVVLYSEKWRRQWRYPSAKELGRQLKSLEKALRNLWFM